jgi:Holliday junction resolvase RusA-like endonuclease
MRVVAEFETFGVACVPWSMPAPVIGKGGKTKFIRKAGPLAAWQEHVAAAARTAMEGAAIALGPVLLVLEFYRQTPPGKRDGDFWAVGVERTAKGQHVKRGEPQPDLANLVKGAEDALQGVIIGNDVQTCAIRTVRLYGPRDGMRVKVCELEPGDRLGIGLTAFGSFHV